MTSGQGGNGAGSYDDPYAYQPTLAFAHTSDIAAAERVEEAEEIAAKALLDGERANPIAVLARDELRNLTAQIRHARNIVAEAYAATLRADAAGEQTSEHVEHAVEAYRVVSGLFTDIESVATAAGTLDQPQTMFVEDPLPDTVSWKIASESTHADTLGWCASVRGQKGQFAQLAPSPGVGKTHAMIAAALQEQRERVRTIVAVPTKQNVEQELVPRFKSAKPYVRLHVIHGRDERTCLNFANVSAVQEHGYAPGSAVCPGCEHHPGNAARLGVQMCPYYETRTRAALDNEVARRTGREYAILITTHASLVSSLQSGGGAYGAKLWTADLIMIDEDPTSSMEPVITVTPSQTEYKSAEAARVPISHAAAVLNRVIEIGEAERKASEATGFAQRAEIHRRDGSCYASADLHALLSRAFKDVAHTLQGADDHVQVFRDAAEATMNVSRGALYGADEPVALSALAPPRSLIRLSDILADELILISRLKSAAAQRLYKSARRSVKALETFEFAYRVRLEWNATSGWNFIAQDFVEFPDDAANLLVADAYAHTDHYRGIFNKPTPKTGRDCVTVIRHIAHMAPGTNLIRFPVRSTMRFYNEGGWQETIGFLATLLREYAGQKVLVYGHSSLREQFDELMQANDCFGVQEYAYEHFWGGRGKDKYRDWPVAIVISEPIVNIGALYHIVNAREFRLAARAVAPGAQKPDFDESMQHAVRITTAPRSKRTVGQWMTDDVTHAGVRLEHARQNINELAQALHRVRPSMHAVTMIVLGYQTPLSRELLAASSVVGIDEPPDPSRGRLWNVPVEGYVTEKEILEAMLALEERLGVWTPLFRHALMPFLMPRVGTFPTGDFRIPEIELGHQDVGSSFSPLSGRMLKRIETDTDRPDKAGLDADALPAGLLLDAPAAVLTSSSSDLSRLSVPGLIDRAWTPPPGWELLNEHVETRMGGRMRAATQSAPDLFRAKRYMRPSWWPASQKGPGVVYYSTRQWKSAESAMREILVDRYGPTNGHRVNAPRMNNLIPF